MSERGDKPVVYRQGSIDSLYKLPLELTWILTDLCNFQCSYCTAHGIRNAGKSCNWEQASKIIDYLAQLNRDNYRIHLTGGEPTINPVFVRIINRLHERLGTKLDFTRIFTNGSKHDEIYSQLSEIASEAKLQFIVSLHAEHTKFENIVRMIEDYSHKMSFVFNLVFHPGKWEMIKRQFIELCELRRKFPFAMTIILVFHPDKVDNLDPRYTTEMLEWRNVAQNGFNDIAACSVPYLSYDKKGDTYWELNFFWDFMQEGVRKYEKWNPYQVERVAKFNNGFFGFKNIWCMHGTTSFSIFPDGTFCGANCAMVKPRYNIYECNPFIKDDLIDGVKCSLDNCACSANDIIMKFSSNEEAMQYRDIFFQRQQKKLVNPFS